MNQFALTRIASLYCLAALFSFVAVVDCSLAEDAPFLDVSNLVGDETDDAKGEGGRDEFAGKGCGGCDCCCVYEPWVVSRESCWCDECWNLDCVTNALSFETCCSKFSLTGGAHHWWHQSLRGAGGGYGIPGIRNTYFWYLRPDLEYNLDSGRKIGARGEIRLRETGNFRNFMDQSTWPWELYGYVSDEDWGTLKGGLIYTQFGLFWGNSWFGNAPYFDGYKLDADYGLSWERTYDVDNNFKIDTFCQFFFHEDQSNGSFGGGDAESVVGYTERNTGIVRMVPTWTLSNGAVFALGISGKVGQIDSSVPTLNDQTIAAYAVDATYTRGRWRLFAEGMQHFGNQNPVRYVSGGPSNRITNVLTGFDYTVGAVTYRASYSNSFDANPDARQHFIDAGTTIKLTKNVDLYIEYVYQRIDGNANPASDGEVFNSVEYIINWHF